MNLAWILLAVLLILATGFFLVRLTRAAHLYVKLLGKRVITCPETAKPAAVGVAARHVALEALVAEPHLLLSNCSRWPERQDCGQTCLSRIEAAPDDCLVSNVVKDWYRSRTCAYCGNLFGEMNWIDRRGALLSPDGKTILWDAVSPETLPGILATHWPVCWTCHIAQTFRREHPDLVVDRPWKRSGPCGEIACQPEDKSAKANPPAEA
jgi:hypothetical protein